jgi:hypothetical protein
MTTTEWITISSMLITAGVILSSTGAKFGKIESGLKNLAEAVLRLEKSTRKIDKRLRRVEKKQR